MSKAGAVTAGPPPPDLPVPGSVPRAWVARAPGPGAHFVYNGLWRFNSWARATPSPMEADIQWR